MARKVSEINAASMADIAFMLLIFFLVTTTMDVDTGLYRLLPPIPENIDEDPPPIKERNVFVVLINRNNQLLVEGVLTDISELKEKTKEFIENPNDASNLPVKKLTKIDFFGEIPVTKGIISLRNDRGTEYQIYLKVTNELMAAYNELREELSQQKFQMSFGDLPSPKKNAIKKIYKHAISEAEPKNVGGNNNG